VLRAVHGEVGNPGVVLANGDPVAIWRPRKQGSRLTVVIEPLTGVPAALRGDVAAEAATLAPYRGATTVEVEFS